MLTREMKSRGRRVALAALDDDTVSPDDEVKKMRKEAHHRREVLTELEAETAVTAVMDQESSRTRSGRLFQIKKDIAIDNSPADAQGKEIVTDQRPISDHEPDQEDGVSGSNEDDGTAVDRSKVQAVVTAVVEETLVASQPISAHISQNEQENVKEVSPADSHGEERATGNKDLSGYYEGDGTRLVHSEEETLHSEENGVAASSSKSRSLSQIEQSNLIVVARLDDTGKERSISDKETEELREELREEKDGRGSNEGEGAAENLSNLETLPDEKSAVETPVVEQASTLPRTRSGHISENEHDNLMEVFPADSPGDDLANDHSSISENDDDEEQEEEEDMNGCSKSDGTGGDQLEESDEDLMYTVRRRRGANEPKTDVNYEVAPTSISVQDETVSTSTSSSATTEVGDEEYDCTEEERLEVAIITSMKAADPLVQNAAGCSHFKTEGNRKMFLINWGNGKSDWHYEDELNPSKHMRKAMDQVEAWCQRNHNSYRFASKTPKYKGCSGGLKLFKE